MKLTFALISLLVLLASSASATSIALNTTAPTTDVYASFTTVAMDSTSITNVWRNWKSKVASTDYDQTVGTTFQIGASDVVADKATILVARTTAVNNAPMKFILYHASQRDDAGGDLLGTFGAPAADTIVTQFTGTINFPLLTGSAVRYVTFDFDDVQLTAGEWYGFYGLIDGMSSTYGTWKSSFNASTTPGPNSNSSALRVADTNRDYVVADGTGAGYDGDIAYWVQATVVPEPSSIILLLCGVIAAGLMKIKR